MVFEHQNYRDYLKEVLTARSRNHPKYSLRRFASQLGLQPSLLSEILRGKRHLSEDAAVRVSERLGLADGERDYLRLLVQLDRAKSPRLRGAIQASLKKLHPERGEVRDLSVDAFRVVSDWQHFALLKLSEVPGFVWSAKAAAQALGIHEYEVEESVRRLERLELVVIDPSGRPVKTAGNFSFQSPVRNEALRKYHTQMLEKTVEALTTQGPTERFTGTENVVLDRSQMKEAAAIFEDCFHRILALSKRAPPRGSSPEVYHLGLHMLRLTRAHAEPAQSQNSSRYRKGNENHENA